jgi:hypothetical protein
MNFNDLKNESEYTFFDVTSEEYREYVFIGLGTIKIDSPVAVAVSKSCHRVLDSAGISHFVPAEWQMINWKAKEGQPHFVK